MASCLGSVFAQTQKGNSSIRQVRCPFYNYSFGIVISHTDVA